MDGTRWNEIYHNLQLSKRVVLSVTKVIGNTYHTTYFNKFADAISYYADCIESSEIEEVFMGAIRHREMKEMNMVDVLNQRYFVEESVTFLRWP